MEAVAAGGWGAGSRLGDGTPLPGRSRCCPRNKCSQRRDSSGRRRAGLQLQNGERPVCKQGRPVKRERPPALQASVISAPPWDIFGTPGGTLTQRAVPEPRDCRLNSDPQ